MAAHYANLFFTTAETFCSFVKAQKSPIGQ